MSYADHKLLEYETVLIPASTFLRRPKPLDDRGMKRPERDLNRVFSKFRFHFCRP